MINIGYDVIAITALFTGSVALIFSYVQNSKLRAQIERQQETLSSVAADVNAMCSGAVNLGEHLAHLEQRAHQLIQRQDQLELNEPSSQSYKHASRMMGNGADLEEVMENCGLARGEAELVALAQRIKKAS